MKTRDLIRLSLANLMRRKGRTALTVIGVVIGTCSIVVMVSLGQGINVAYEEMLKSWGDLSMITIYNWGGGPEVPELNDDQVAVINKLENVVVASPIYRPRYLQANIVTGSQDRYQTGSYRIIGMYAEAIEAFGYNLMSGSPLPKYTVGAKALNMIAGEQAAFQFEDTKQRQDSPKRYNWPEYDENEKIINEPFFDIIDAKFNLITTKNSDDTGKQLTYNINITGIMKEDTTRGYDVRDITSNSFIMDIEALKALEKEYMRANNIREQGNGNGGGAVRMMSSSGAYSSGGSQSGYDTVYVKVNDYKKVSAVDEQLKEMGYQTYSMETERKNMQAQSNVTQMVLGGLGAVSLLVAAFGITNTMTMAIYERTKEIGILKVLGCKVISIRLMFLAEAGFIGLLGGIVGITTSFILSIALNSFGSSFLGGFLGIGTMGSSRISIIPYWLAVGGTVFAMFIGLISGIMPAGRATKISALEALRHE